MPRIAYYWQDCPTCGRTLQVRVEYLGRSLCCPHCRGQFQAADPSGPRSSAPDARLSLLARANELLETMQLHHPS